MIYSKVKQTIKKKALIKKGDRIVVGVSGGPDSVALLNILADIGRTYDIKLFITHLNHKLRGEAAHLDADFVKHLAKRMRIPCLIEEEDVKSLAKRLKMSVEDAAREARYALYERAAKKFKADKIATAHTLDDQAETVLMRLLKGSGSLGLAGIPYKRRAGRFLVIRPLLDTPRKDIEKYLKKNKIGTRLDASNLENVYLRNKIRNQLIPFLEKTFNPNIKEGLSFLAVILSDESSLLSEIAGRKMKQVEHPAGKATALSVKALSCLHPALQRIVVRLAIAKVKGNLKNISYKHWSAIEAILNGTEQKSVNLPEGIRVVKSGDRLLFLAKDSAKKTDHYFSKVLKLRIPGEVAVQELSVIIKARAVKNAPSFLKKKDKNTEYVNGDILGSVLAVRTRREGDRIKPLGMKSPKKLHDIFVDEKVPYETRDRLPVILSGNDILWVAGVKLSDDFKLKDGTKKIIKLSAVRS
ncbi:MAG: tRNA lysidine(34) synthetase TilS [Candidatus Omnitrophica bacterium]|nr:tRNA lysidine(34) synthetase TilS [Candidatus Omnitrophota bacterium]MBU4487577.1 tRNA lysidine(34) synthetase TilS [Candidatus Omnitrophota bacterium]MCG2705594.1 tRNA lysidine(34) synthetase TilS [Candidatus Omnitrophota bacterium]